MLGLLPLEGPRIDVALPNEPCDVVADLVAAVAYGVARGVRQCAARGVRHYPTRPCIRRGDRAAVGVGDIAAVPSVGAAIVPAAGRVALIGARFARLSTNGGFVLPSGPSLGHLIGADPGLAR